MTAASPAPAKALPDEVQPGEARPDEAQPRPMTAIRPGAAAPGLRGEWFLGVGAAAVMTFLLAGPALAAALAGPSGMAALFAMLFAAVLGSALAVVRHAEHLAVQVGEPYGTLILTFSVTAIEVVSISAVILHGENNPTLVRDSLLSVVMIILNGMVGLSLLIGAWRHHEQRYNLQGANAYLGVILPLAVLSLVLPTFTRATAGPTLSWTEGAFLAAMSVCLYATFLCLQTGRHHAYFMDAEAVREDLRRDGLEGSRAALHHTALLVAYMLVIVVLADHLAQPIDYFVETLHAPAALGGLAMAFLAATPEALGAVRAAFQNRLRRAVNIFLGWALATIGLTVPAMLVISELTGHGIILGVDGPDLVMLLLTLAVSIVTFASGNPTSCRAWSTCSCSRPTSS